MHTFVSGITKSGLFNIAYDPDYQVVFTDNGTREYAVFSAYI